MLDRLKQKIFHRVGEANFIDLPQPGELEDKRIIYQNRYNYGVNLGSMFLLEKYIFHGLFDKGGENEYDAICNQVKASSFDEAAGKLSAHYDSYLKRVDWNWLKEVGCTAIRIPIGYWHVKNGELLEKHESFYSLREAYIKAKPWDKLKEVVKIAKDNDIGVLIDLHGLPGGANRDAHSGESFSGDGSFFKEERYVSFVTDIVIPFIVQDLQPNENLIGLQIVNEAQFSDNGKYQKRYYEKAVYKIREINKSLPVVISDGWWPDQWADWVQDRNLFSDVVIDSHVYRCFSDEDKNSSADEIINKLSDSVQFDKSKCDFMVGEFSCVLDGKTYEKSSSDRNAIVRKFGQCQIEIFQQKASWGWFFWTLQFESGDGGEWGFIPMVERECIPRRPTSWTKPDDGAIQNIIQNHVTYWADKGGKNMEHWRFEDALRSTIMDIESFVQFKNSLLGRVCAWKHSRRAQYIQAKGDSEYMWEWDQGFQQAIKNFNHY